MHNVFRSLRKLLRAPRRLYLSRIWGYRIHPTAFVSLGASLDRSNPAGIVIGAYSIVTKGAIVLAHDYVRSLRCETRIGENCFVGVGAIIMPGVDVGSGSIVGAGAVVTKNVPPGSLVLGNPAVVVRQVVVGRYGKLLEADR